MRTKLRIRSSLATLLFVGAITLICEIAQAVDFSGLDRYRGLDNQRPADWNSGNNNRSNSDSSEPSTSSDSSAAQQAYDSTWQQCDDAWKRKDYREALSWAQQQQTLRDGPNVRKNIADLKALIVWGDAKTAADYRRAITMRPEAFNQECVHYVEQLEAQEKLERERAKREAEAVKKARKDYNKLVSSLDKAPPKAGWFVTQDKIITDVFGTHKAQAHLEFGYANSPEAMSEQARQGFDTSGPLKGSATVINPATPTTTATELAPSVPQKFRNDPRIVEYQKQWKDAKIEQAIAEKKLAVIRQLRESPSANKGELDVKEAKVRMSHDAAQSKLNTIKVRVLDFTVARL